MPVYAFRCAGCGPFDLVRPMGQADSAARCPACGDDARRVFTAPAVARVGASVRRALESEEKSAHEPAVVSQKQGRPLPHSHAPSPPWTLGH